jgi:hypothetical protein
MQQSSRRNQRNLWPSGRSQAMAVLAFEPEEIRDRNGVQFEEDVDDLDRLVFAVLRLDDGSNALLYKHDGDPNPGTVVNVDARADLARERESLMNTLRLENGDLLWVAPGAERHRMACA